MEASRAYAEANGLELAEGSELEDIGVSAFKGANVREGALGRFLEAIRAGVIKPGSYLIVESLDRLSRQQIVTAQSLFLSIIQAGINLVTLTDGRVYQAGTNDLGDLIVSLVIMSRAHEESQTKSLRLAAAWKDKRASAALLSPMTKWCPAWLRLAEDRSSYEEIPDRVAVVRQIFKDSAGGIGIYKIVRRLKESNTQTFNDSKGWHESYISKILANRAVIGEFQPGVRRNGKRIPEGEPVQRYFPVIIDEKLFYSAQQGKSQRRLSGAGRKGIDFSNLFTGLAKCAYCGAGMTYDNKGNGPKGGRYLLCNNAKRGLGCPGKRWRYADFEASFLAFVSEVDISSIIDAENRGGERAKAATNLSALEGELGTVTALMDRTYELLNEGAPSQFIASKLRDLDQRQSELVQAIFEQRTRLETLEFQSVRINESKEQIYALVKRLQGPGGVDLFELRAKVAAHLKSVIETLVVAPLGERPRIARIVDNTRNAFGEEASDVVQYIQQRGENPDQARRYFAVGFRDSRIRIVFPRNDDPMRYQQQIVAKERALELLSSDNRLPSP